MPQTPIYGWEFEDPDNDLPARTLSGGPTGAGPVLAKQIETEVARIDPALNQLIDQGTYTPTLTSTGTAPNLGANGVIEGAWYRVGFGIWFWARWLYSGTGVDGGSGQHIVSLPFAADANFNSIVTSSGQATHIGAGYMSDASDQLNSQGIYPYLRTTTDAGARLDSSLSGISEGFPISWADGDAVSLSGSYIADPAGLP